MTQKYYSVMLPLHFLNLENLENLEKNLEKGVSKMSYYELL